MITFDDLDIQYLPSGRLWKGLAAPTSFGPLGTTTIGQSGNPAFGFYDNFHSFHASSLEGPYRILEGTGCTIEQIADTNTEKGLVQLTIDGNAANDEAVLQWGRGLGAPFRLANNDLAFEACLSVSAITAAKWSWAVGLGEVAMGATDQLFVDSTGAVADRSFLGFVKLAAAAGPVSAAYRALGQAYQSGANKTKLGNVVTMAPNVYTKLGFRYRAHPQMVEFFVNGRLAGSASVPARLTSSEINHVTFPSAPLLTPIIGIKDTAGDTAFNIKLDWMACVQLL